MNSTLIQKATLSEPKAIMKVFHTFMEQGGTEADFEKMLEEMGFGVEQMRFFLDLHHGDGKGVMYKMPNRKITIPDTSTATPSGQFMMDLFRLIPNISWTSDFESDFQRMVIRSHQPYNLCAAKLMRPCSDQEVREKLGIEMIEITIDAAHWAMVSDDGTGKYLSHDDNNVLQVKNIWGVSSKISITWMMNHWHLDSVGIDLRAGTQFLFQCPL